MTNAEFRIRGVPRAVGRFVEALPASLEDAQTLAPGWHLKQGVMLLRLPGIATYRVTDGRLVEIAPEAGSDPLAVEMVLDGVVRAALLHQRGDLPLHAVCLLPPGGDRAIAICGSSGSGKSELGIELVQRGWSLVADNTCCIHIEEGLSIISAESRGMRLWQGTCDRFGIETASLNRVRQGIDKFYVPVAQTTGSVRLGLVLELIDEEGGLLVLSSPAERMSMLSQHGSRARLTSLMGTQMQHLHTVAQTVTACRSGKLFGALGGKRRVLADSIEEAARWIAT